MYINIYFTFLLIVTTIIMLIISYFAWRKGRSKVARCCSILMIAASFYSFGYAFEIANSSLQNVKFWLRIEYIGIPFIAVLWLILVIHYTGYEEYLNKHIYILLFIIPLVTFVLHYTNDFHHLFYKDMRMNYKSLFPLVELTKGPAYWVHIFYTYIVLIIGMTLFFKMYLSSVKVVREQIIMMILGTAAPWILNVIYVLGMSWYNIDLEPFGFALSGIFYSWAIYKFNLLRLTPIALSKVFESMKDGVILLDFENNITNFNNSAKKIIPELGELNSGGNKVQDIFRNYPEILNCLDYNEVSDCQLCVHDISGQKYFDFSITTVYESEDVILGRIMVLSDITRQREMVLRLDKLASTDELTQLYNRRHFYERCQSEIDRATRYGRPLSFIIFDIDHFKSINDNYGHHVGDLVLKHISNICKSNMRSSDIVARYGGEEFAVLLPETTTDIAITIAEKLRQLINSKPYIGDDLKVNITSSFGVHGFNGHKDEKLSELMIKADRALYKAKNYGRNRVVLYSDIN